MHKFVRALLTEWRKLPLPQTGETFVVAVSGGADSIGLAAALHELRRLKKLNLRFVIAHFNHDLRAAESDADESFVRNFAEQFEFELACGRIENPKSKIQNQKGNLEQNARDARYEFLLETAANLRACGILTAHTTSDQAETFLLNLIRGSGLEGLGGMKPVSRRQREVQDSKLQIQDSALGEQSQNENRKSEILLVRPFLNWAARERTLDFCLENKIEFRSDSMNDDLAFRRVRIRKVLLPMLAEFNPKIVETLSATANLLREDFAELERSASAAAGGFQSKRTPDENSLELKELKNLFPSMRRQILREWLKSCRGGSLRRLESKHFEAIENLSTSRKSGRLIELPGGETIAKSGGRLRFEKSKVEKTLSDNYNQRLDSGSAAGAFGNND